MVVQSKKTQILLLICSVVFVVALGVIGYLFLRGDLLSRARDGKFLGELVLYLSLLFAVLIAAIYIMVFVKNRNLLRELDKIIEMSRYNNFSPAQGLERLGPIGEKIGQIYSNVNQVSEKRALKISSLYSLTRFLLDNVALPIVITDVRGSVTSLSKQFREKFEEQTNLIGASIHSLYPDLKLQQVADNFEENYSSMELKQGRTDLTVYPIRNRDHDIAYYVFVIGKGALVQDDAVQQVLEKLQRNPEKQGLFSRLIGRRGRK